jgi:hypothetical protein
MERQSRDRKSSQDIGDNSMKKERNSFLITVFMLIGAGLLWYAIKADLFHGLDLGKYLFTSLANQLMNGLSGGR